MSAIRQDQTDDRAKAGVVALTQSLAKEVGGDGIRVNCVCPGYVRTSMQDRELVWEAGLRNMTAAKVRAEYVSLTPLGRIEEPEDVADVVVFLASDLARFMTGEAVCVTGKMPMITRHEVGKGLVFVTLVPGMLGLDERALDVEWLVEVHRERDRPA